MNRNKLTAGLVAAALTVSLVGCGASGDWEERENQQDQTTLDNSLGIQNLKERLKREEDPNAIRYLYLMSFGDIIGYYVTKGKISSSAGQLAPEEDLIKPWNGSSDLYNVDSAKDDGTYGVGDPGIFFFTTDGVMVETSLDYIQSDAPLAIDAPRLGGAE
ncbi:hypothetical protein CQ047_18275 [Microbacterium sp. MYb72]|uniref:hypothetical protein n=1 Tax=Microbacterium sp. MYb72 TaxID=1848693 RepID=UPI000CFC122A|nr:hypothetical protein [Microbacterium sp. MYb72]PRB01805.1 hypothetical protein CQ047_18275 [Microbacterium sp. MYb72]